MSEYQRLLTEYNNRIYELLQQGRNLVQSSISHVSHGGPTREDAEKWVAEATKALEEPQLPSQASGDRKAGAAGNGGEG